jgi:hypothetical protein
VQGQQLAAAEAKAERVTRATEALQGQQQLIARLEAVLKRERGAMSALTGRLKGADKRAEEARVEGAALQGRVGSLSFRLSLSLPPSLSLSLSLSLPPSPPVWLSLARHVRAGPINIVEKAAIEAKVEASILQSQVLHYSLLLAVHVCLYVSLSKS